MLGFHAKAWLLTTTSVPCGRGHPLALAVAGGPALVMEALFAGKTLRRIGRLRHFEQLGRSRAHAVAFSSAAFTWAAELKARASSAGSAPK
jgi:hypothetical protein